MNTSKSAIMASTISGKIASIIGYCGVALFSLGMFTLFTDGEIESASICLVFIAISFLFVLRGLKIKNRIRRFKRYIALISEERIRLISIIASSTGQTEDFIRRDISEMISKKFFNNASIDLTNNEIIIGVRDEPTSFQPEVHEEMDEFTCTGCGAIGLKAQGGSGVCDYCGTVNN